MRIGKIANSAEYRMDERYQNLCFGFLNWFFFFFEILLIFQSGQFQKFPISNFKNLEN